MHLRDKGTSENIKKPHIETKKVKHKPPLIGINKQSIKIQEIILLGSSGEVTLSDKIIDGKVYPSNRKDKEEKDSFKRMIAHIKKIAKIAEERHRAALANMAEESVELIT